MVTIFSFAPTLDSGRTQLRVGTPSRCTVHAPQAAMPQPYLVPVRPSCSRSTHSSGVSGSASNSRGAPLTWILAMLVSPSWVLGACGMGSGQRVGPDAAGPVPGVHAFEFGGPRRHAARAGDDAPGVAGVLVDAGHVDHALVVH